MQAMAADDLNLLCGFQRHVGEASSSGVAHTASPPRKSTADDYSTKGSGCTRRRYESGRSSERPGFPIDFAKPTSIRDHRTAHDRSRGRSRSFQVSNGELSVVSKATLGIIGGSGLYDLPELEVLERVAVATPYGAPSDSLIVGTL